VIAECNISSEAGDMNHDEYVADKDSVEKVKGSPV
jgi:hypothetical protein